MSRLLERFGATVVEALAAPGLVAKVRGEVVVVRVAGRRSRDLVRFVDPSTDAPIMTARLKVGRRWREVGLRGTARHVAGVLATELRPLWERPYREVRSARTDAEAPATHLVPGASAGAMHTAAISPLVKFGDALVEGPCPPVVLSDSKALHEWRRVRDAWWGEPGVPWLWPADANLASPGRLVVWATDQCDELLMLAFSAAVFEPSELWLARPTSAGGRRPRSVGETAPHWLLAVEPRPVDELEYALLVDIWFAYTAGDPGLFFELVHAHPDSLIGGLADLRNRLPHPETGLTTWEGVLLGHLRAAGERHAADLLSRALVLGQREGNRDLGGDVVVFRWLVELAQAGLVVSKGRGESWNTSFELTTRGLAVLEGRANRLELAGFDRWFGGTRGRYPEGPLWTWDGHTVHEEPT